MGESGAILIYDDCCNLCRRVERFLQRIDRHGRIEALPLRSERAEGLIARCGLQADTDSVILMDGSDCYIRSDAILKAFALVGGRWRLFQLLRVVPRFIRDYLYSAIAFNRYRLFGRSCKCG